jgi:maltooligosyltrehalose trehalohydrolase
VLAWAERDDPVHAQMLSWYRTLIEARRSYPELRDPRPGSCRVTMERGVVRIERGGFRLLCNLRNEAIRVAMDGEVIAASEPSASERELPPVSCALLRV